MENNSIIGTVDFEALNREITNFELANAQWEGDGEQNETETEILFTIEFKSRLRHSDRG